MVKSTPSEVSSEKPLVSIILVNQNGKKWLQTLLKSIQESDYPEDSIELIFVDNGSTDGSADFVRKECRAIKAKVIENKKNLGWSPANDQGARVADGEILVFLSNDMQVDVQWLNEILKVITLKPSIAVVQCNSVSMSDKTIIDSGMNFLDKYGFAYSYVPQGRPKSVFFAEGMAFAIKHDVFDQVGGFDEYYFMEYDDMDLCWRVRLAGYDVFFAPASIVYHARGGTVGSSYFTKRTRNITLYVRNQYVTLLKNFELKNLPAAVTVVTSFQMAKIIYFAVRKKSELTIATIKGALMALKDLKLIWKKRQQSQYSIRKVSDKQISSLFHPFQPKLLYSFLVSQAKGKRLVLKMKPPIWRESA